LSPRVDRSAVLSSGQDWRGLIGPRIAGMARSALTGSLIAAFASQLILVVSGIIAARILGPKDRGYLALLVLIPLILAQIGGMGLPPALTYYVASAPQHATAILKRLGWPVAMQISAIVIAQLAIDRFALAGEPPRVRTGAAIAISYTVFLFTQQLLLSLIQGQKDFKSFNILRVLPSGLYSVALVGLLAAHARSLLVVFSAATATSGIAAVITGACAVRGLRRSRPDREGAELPARAEIVRFGLKGFLGSVSPIENLRLDQASIALFLNPVALGLYVVAQSFTNLPRFVAQSIGMIAYPTVASDRDPVSARRRMWRYALLSAALCSAVVVALEAAATPLVHVLFGSAFAGAVTITRILLVGVVFLAVRRTLSDAARGAKRPGAGSLAEGASWIALVIGFVLLAPRMGAEGVAIALSVAWMFSFVVLVVAICIDDWRHFAQAVRDAVPANWSFLPAALISAAALGSAFAALLPLPASLLILAAVIASLAFAYVRARLRVHARRLSLAWPAGRLPTAAAMAGDFPDLRLARLLYYAGLALIGELSIRPIHGFTLSDSFFLLSLPAAFAGLVVRHRRAGFLDLPSLLVLGMTLLVLGGLFSTFGADAPVHSISVIVRLVYVTIVWFWVGTVVLQHESHVRSATAVWVVSVAVCGAAAIAQSVFGNVVPGGHVAWGRVTGFTQNFNDLGGLSAVAFVPALMLMLSRGLSVVRRLLFIGALICISGGLLFSGSVGSVFAAAVATVIWFGSQAVGARRTIALALIAATVFGAYSVQTSLNTPDAIQRIVGVGNGAPQDPTRTLDSRITSYRIAWARIQKDPIIGVGLDRESRQAGDFEVHNIFLGTWFSTGFFGLAGIILVLLAAGRAGWSVTARALSSSERAIGLALTCAFAAFATFLMSEPALFTRYGWVAAALIFALWAIQRRGAQGEPGLSTLPAPELAPVAELHAPGVA
jgi:O-antigen/teichoic acid export membrane protein/O-antigen ligase